MEPTTTTPRRHRAVTNFVTSACVPREGRAHSHRGLMTDLRYAIRLLRSSRLFTLTVVLTIAIGIGATTAIFSVVNAVLVRPLPFGEPDRLMQVAEKNDK